MPAGLHFSFPVLLALRTFELVADPMSNESDVDIIPYIKCGFDWNMTKRERTADKRSCSNTTSNHYAFVFPQDPHGSSTCISLWLLAIWTACQALLPSDIPPISSKKHPL